MPCPKCKAQIGLHDAPVVSLGSSLDLTGDARVGFVTGKSCAICGHWIDQTPVAKPRIPQVEPALARPTGPRAGHNSIAKSMEIRDRVAEHYNFIRDARRDRISWEHIIGQLMHQRGLAITSKTLIAHYKALTLNNPQQEKTA